jgi:hypothetical protein
MEGVVTSYVVCVRACHLFSTISEGVRFHSIYLDMRVEALSGANCLPMWEDTLNCLIIISQ